VKRVLLAIMLLAGTTAIRAQEYAEKDVESKDELLVWKWANFVLLAAGAGYLLSKHAPPFFRSRTAEIQKDITEAQANKQAAEKRAAEMDARLNSLGAEIEKFRAESKIEMEGEAERIRQETAHQIEKIQKQAEQEIEAAGTLATRELHTYAAKLALDLAEQRIRTRLDASTEAGLVEDFTKDLQRHIGHIDQPGSKN
jgi:F-type H+-transporting ATPase subunit b